MGAIGFGVLWCFITGGLLCWQLVPQTGEIFGKLCGYGLAITFVCFGFYALVIMPIKDRKEMKHCCKVKGRVVDYTTSISKKKEKIILSYI